LAGHYTSTFRPPHPCGLDFRCIYMQTSFPRPFVEVFTFASRTIVFQPLLSSHPIVEHTGEGPEIRHRYTDAAETMTILASRGSGVFLWRYRLRLLLFPRLWITVQTRSVLFVDLKPCPTFKDLPSTHRHLTNLNVILENLPNGRFFAAPYVFLTFRPGPSLLTTFLPFSSFFFQFLRSRRDFSNPQGPPPSQIFLTTSSPISGLEGHPGPPSQPFSSLGPRNTRYHSLPVSFAQDLSFGSQLSPSASHFFPPCSLSPMFLVLVTSISFLADQCIPTRSRQSLPA